MLLLNADAPIVIEKAIDEVKYRDEVENGLELKTVADAKIVAGENIA